jgi:hypothetical protein
MNSQTDCVISTSSLQGGVFYVNEVDKSLFELDLWTHHDSASFFNKFVNEILKMFTFYDKIGWKLITCCKMNRK